VVADSREAIPCTRVLLLTSDCPWSPFRFAVKHLIRAPPESPLGRPTVMLIDRPGSRSRYGFRSRVNTLTRLRRSWLVERRSL
jgi:hypothetical protein